MRRNETTLWLPGFEPAGSIEVAAALARTPAAMPAIDPIPAPVPGAEEAGAPASGNYSLTAQHLARLGSPIQRCLTNVTAIQTLKRIESEARPATPQEQAVLALYCGWGGIPQAFDPDKTEWSARQAMLREALTQTEFASARASTPNAHYTSVEVITAIYQALEQFGCGGGRVLEPSAGIGHFIGAMPLTWQPTSNATCVELDSISARIGALLYPDARWHHAGFEKTVLIDEYWDVVIGNIPFGDYAVHDPAFNRLKLRIHDYFFAKALSKLRPGGLLAFVTSTGTLDKHSSGAREYLAYQGHFLGAIRLPSGVFQAVANTHVAADIVFLQKKHAGEERDAPRWIEVERASRGPDIITISLGSTSTS
jgi:hypothetical protein